VLVVHGTADANVPRDVSLPRSVGAGAPGENRRPGEEARVLAKGLTCAVVGLDGAPVEAAVDLGPSRPAFDVLGRPDAPIQETRERVRAAIRNSGLEFPNRRRYLWCG